MPDLDVPVLVVAAGVAYGLAVRRAGREVPAAAPSRRRVAAFGAGLLSLLVALGPPLEERAATGLTAHMVQHVILLVVAAPLLAVGRPVATLARLLPERMQGPHLPARAGTPASFPVAWIAVALVAQAAAMWGWHAPPLFDGAVRHEPLHMVEHACLLGTALLFWWAVLNGARWSLGVGVLAMFGAALVGTALGAAMTLATTPWYRSYAAGSRAAALSDQQVAGVVMWAFAGLAYVAAAAVVFFTWLARGEPEPGSDAPVPARRPVVSRA